MLWNTDALPVHLSWFTQQGLAQLAERVGLQAEFLELPPRPPTMTRLLGNDRLGEPILDAWLEPLHRVPFTAARRHHPPHAAGLPGGQRPHPGLLPPHRQPRRPHPRAQRAMLVGLLAAPDLDPERPGRMSSFGGVMHRR
ncbi:MAG: hypothetical protein R2749_24870 [Acidimicrobiales bacterium]